MCNVVVERADLVRGFQHAKDQYVPVTEEELESLEAEANRSIDLKEFIPLASVDPVYFDDTHYLAADKGGEKPYRLLADAMTKSGRVAIAELVSRGKEQPAEKKQLTALCPIRDEKSYQAVFRSRTAIWFLGEGTAGSRYRDPEVRA